MISIFPLWTFQQHLHMEYISLSWYDITELVVPIRIYLIEVCCYHGSYLTKGSSWLNWSHHFESFTVATMTWLTDKEYLGHKWPHIICSTCHSTSRSFPHSWLITGFVTRLTRRVPLEEQELTAYPSGVPEFTHGFYWGSWYSIFSFICMSRRTLFVPLFFFFWPLCCLSFFDLRILITPLVS
jgi:hypothetical protein